MGALSAAVDTFTRKERPDRSQDRRKYSRAEDGRRFGEAEVLDEFLEGWGWVQRHRYASCFSQYRIPRPAYGSFANRGITCMCACITSCPPTAPQFQPML